MKIKLVAIAKDEAYYIPEWFFHHFSMGFDAVDIYVNNTSDCSIDVIEKIKNNDYPINYIISDELYKKDPSQFQINAYKDAVQRGKKDNFTHVMFLDIDEFWCHLGLKKTIKEFIFESKNADVYVFNWLIHRDEDDFSLCFKKSINVVVDRHVKYIVDLNSSFSPGIHNAYGNLSYMNSDSNRAIFVDDFKAHVEADKNIVPSCFILHRLYRGKSEYISMLGRGRPRGDVFKNNRFGYYVNVGDELKINIEEEVLNNFYTQYDHFLNKCNLVLDMQLAKDFVLNRYNSTINKMRGPLNLDDLRALSLALRNVGIKEIDELRKDIITRMSNVKVFQIGFNKAGTASIYHYFKNAGYSAIHWGDGNLSRQMLNNYQQKLNLLSGYDEYQVFTDMEHREPDNSAFYSYSEFYKDLNEQYPNSIFILNYRNVDKWIKSRINHPGYLSKTMTSTNKSMIEVIFMWKRHYYSHIEEVKKYFENKNNLIILDLDNDPKDKLFNELLSRGIRLPVKELPHSHKTSSRNQPSEIEVESEEMKKHINCIRDAAVFFESRDIDIAYQLMKTAAQLRPSGPFIKQKMEEYRRSVLLRDK